MGVEGSDNMTAELVIELSFVLCDHRVMKENNIHLTTDWLPRAEKRVQPDNDEENAEL